MAGTDPVADRLTVGPVRPPVDGVAGSVWRTITLPVRLAAPLVLIGRRVLSGQFWMESVSEFPTDGPGVSLSSADDVQRPRDGVGPLNHRTYRVRISHPSLSPIELVEAFRSDPNRFSPTTYAVFAPDPAPKGLAVDDRLEVKLPGPWNGPVRVAALGERFVRLETLEGHLEAGWIKFSAHEIGEQIDFQIESVARSGDAFFDVLYHRIGIAKLFQTETWAQVLEAGVEVSGGGQVGRIQTFTTIYQGANNDG